MSTTTQDVLLSDERLIKIGLDIMTKEQVRADEKLQPLYNARFLGAHKVRDLYEADRQERIQREAKLLDLLQQGVDAAKVVASRRGPFHADIETHRFLSKVKEQLPNL